MNSGTGPAGDEFRETHRPPHPRPQPPTGASATHDPTPANRPNPADPTTPSGRVIGWVSNRVWWTAIGFVLAVECVAVWVFQPSGPGSPAVGIPGVVVGVVIGFGVIRHLRRKGRRHRDESWGGSGERGAGGGEGTR